MSVCCCHYRQKFFTSSSLHEHFQTADKWFSGSKREFSSFNEYKRKSLEATIKKKLLKTRSNNLQNEEKRDHVWLKVGRVALRKSEFCSCLASHGRPRVARLPQTLRICVFGELPKISKCLKYRKTNDDFPLRQSKQCSKKREHSRRVGGKNSVKY